MCYTYTYLSIYLSIYIYIYIYIFIFIHQITIYTFIWKVPSIFSSMLSGIKKALLFQGPYVSCKVIIKDKVVCGMQPTFTIPYFSSTGCEYQKNQKVCWTGFNCKPGLGLPVVVDFRLRCTLHIIKGGKYFYFNIPRAKK